MLANLVQAARRLAAGRPDPADVAAVHDAVDYFQRAVTRHFLDEEGSVFPRLSTRRPELAEALAALSAEHPTQIAMQGEVAEAARGLHGELRPGAGKTLLEAAEKLAAAHRSHVSREDALFTTAQEALTEQDDVDIAAEMETRRDRDREAAAPAAVPEQKTRLDRSAPKKRAPAKKAAPAKKPTQKMKSVPAKKATPKTKSVQKMTSVPAKKSVPANKAAPAKKPAPKTKVASKKTATRR